MVGLAENIAAQPSLAGAWAELRNKVTLVFLMNYLSYQAEDILTLLPTGLSFPGCHGGGQNLPPQLKSHLGVLDSNSFIHALKAISN